MGELDNFFSFCDHSSTGRVGLIRKTRVRDGESGKRTDDSSYTEPVLDHFISGSGHVTHHCTYRVVYVQMKKLARRQNEDGQQSGGVKDKKTAPPGGAAAAAAAAAGGGAGKNHNKRTSRDDDILRMPVHYTLSFTQHQIAARQRTAVHVFLRKFLCRQLI